MTILLFLACDPDKGPVPSDSGVEAVDERIADDDASALSDHDVRFYGPEVVIQPYEDKMYCIFGTYTGEDVGIWALKTWQGPGGHHVQLMSVAAGPEVYPDGMVMDCTASDSIPMGDVEPLVIPTEGNLSEVSYPLPEGMAVKLRSGTRFLVQSHYLNTTEQAIRVRDVNVAAVKAEADVEVWGAPFVANTSMFEIPAGEKKTHSFDCPIAKDYHVLYINGHMHEWGTNMKIERVVDGVASTLYEVPVWDTSFRDVPPTTHYADGEMFFSAGDVIRTTCNWDNTTDHTLAFPSEMCDGVAMVYPTTVPDICDE